MKIFLKTIGIVVSIFLCMCITYLLINFAVPYIAARADYEQQFPTIEKLEKEISTLKTEKDSLIIENEHYKLKLKVQEDMINEMSKSKELQKHISSQLKSLKEQMEATKLSQNEPNDIK